MLGVSICEIIGRLKKGCYSYNEGMSIFVCSISFKHVWLHAFKDNLVRQLPFDIVSIAIRELTWTPVHL